MRISSIIIILFIVLIFFIICIASGEIPKIGDVHDPEDGMEDDEHDLEKNGRRNEHDLKNGVHDPNKDLTTSEKGELARDYTSEEINNIIEANKLRSDKKKQKYHARKKVKSRGESICRDYLENAFDVKFPNCRPEWLVNPETGYKLELDCYNEELKIAVEYNGEQHYVFPNVFHKTKEQFDAQIRRDKYKEQLCKENGVVLISVPYDVRHKDIPGYIEKEISRLWGL